MYKIVLIISALLISFQIYTQTLQWRAIPNAPTNNIKLDDCYFINENTGWVISGQGPQGRIYKTTNGGINWSQQFAVNGYYRCVGFADSLKGWIGDLLSNRLFQTTNGGSNWNVYTLPSPAQSGVCGIYVVNKDYIFACGRIEMPAYFYKTTNGGINWSAQSMSAHASALVDCYFMNKDTGIVVGGIDSPLTANTRAVILRTTNGGNNWINTYTGLLNIQWCWKANFVSKDTGYVSIESWRFEDTVSYLKTTNGGINWQLFNFSIDTTKFHQQGILFLKNGYGWSGGYNCCAPSVTNGKTYETINGGISWSPVLWGTNVNRFRYINDTTIYAVGKTVYKYSRFPIGIHQISTEVPKSFTLHQNYPNPFNPNTNIKFEIPKNSFVTIKVYDALGKEIAELANENLSAGIYSVNWDASAYPSGIYFYKIVTGEYSVSKKMILIK